MSISTTPRAPTKRRSRPDTATRSDEISDGNSVLSDVATATLHHDRDELDCAIVRLVLNHLNAHSVTLFRLVKEERVKRVLGKVVGTREGAVRTLPSIETTALPLLTDLPAWKECVTCNRVVKSAGPDGRRMTYFPIPGEREVVGILALETTTAPRPRAAALVRDVLQIIKNHLSLLDYGELDTL